jgi:hypothetical protein
MPFRPGPRGGVVEHVFVTGGEMEVGPAVSHAKGRKPADHIGDTPGTDETRS